MIISLPLQDEFCRGHVARIGRLNGCKGYKATINALLIHRSKRERCIDKYSELELVASTCGMKSNHYALHHSLLPLRSIIESKVVGSKHISWHQKNELKQGMQTFNYQKPRLCEACIAEDVEMLGYSYWRRAHQLPGSVRCVKHGNLLREFEFQNAFDAMPMELINDSTVCGAQFMNESIDPGSLLNSCLEEFVAFKEGRSKPKYLRRVIMRKQALTGSKLKAAQDPGQNVEPIFDQVKARQNLILSLCKFV